MHTTVQLGLHRCVCLMATVNTDVDLGKLTGEFYLLHIGCYIINSFKNTCKEGRRMQLCNRSSIVKYRLVNIEVSVSPIHYHCYFSKEISIRYFANTFWLENLIQITDTL